MLLPLALVTVKQREQKESVEELDLVLSWLNQDDDINRSNQSECCQLPAVCLGMPGRERAEP
jgi:hypothetical protein